MSQPVRYRPKDRDQITWERDRVRLQTEARLFMSQVMNRALFELGSERRFQETPSDTDCQFLILKHVSGQVCAPERHSGCFYTGDQVKITDSAGKVLATAEPQAPQVNGQAERQGYGPPPGYVQPAPGQPYYMPAPAPAENGFGVTGLVLGIIGLVFSWVPGLNLLLGVLATVFGALGWRKGRNGRATNGGPALAGMIMGIITIVIAVGLAILVGLSLPSSG